MTWNGRRRWWCSRPVNKGSQVVYEGTDAIEVPANGSVAVEVVLGGGRYYDASGLTSARSALVANTEADGSGSDAKNAVSVVVVEVGGGGVVTFSNSGAVAAFVLGFEVTGIAWPGKTKGGWSTGRRWEVDGADWRVECRYVGLWTAAQRIATARLGYTGRLRRLYRVEVFDVEGRGMCELLKTRVGQGVRVVDSDGDWGFEGAYLVAGVAESGDGLGTGLEGGIDGSERAGGGKGGGAAGAAGLEREADAGGPDDRVSGGFAGAGGDAGGAGVHGVPVAAEDFAGDVCAAGSGGGDFDSAQKR